MKRKILNLFVSLCLLIVMAAIVEAKIQKIEKGSKVTFNYVLKWQGKVVESSADKGPIQYVYGQGVLLPGLEKKLAGLKEGDKKSFTLKPKEAYGEFDPKAYKEYSKTEFPADISPSVGNIIQINIPGRRPRSAVIHEVKEDSIIVNLNHPLAGKTVEVEVDILEVDNG